MRAARWQRLRASRTAPLGCHPAPDARTPDRQDGTARPARSARAVEFGATRPLGLSGPGKRSASPGRPTGLISPNNGTRQMMCTYRAKTNPGAVCP
jgi:hypothetical protein